MMFWFIRGLRKIMKIICKCIAEIDGGKLYAKFTRCEFLLDQFFWGHVVLRNKI